MNRLQRLRAVLVAELATQQLLGGASRLPLTNRGMTTNVLTGRWFEPRNRPGIKVDTGGEFTVMSIEERQIAIFESSRKVYQSTIH